MRDVAVIILAGGKSSRFGSEVPKQFLPLYKKPVVCHSLDVFVQMPDVKEIVVVADTHYHHIFNNYPVLLAEPGLRRQDSLYNGLSMVSESTQWICVHDGARPLISKELVDSLFSEGRGTKAATLGISAKATIKEATNKKFISKTLNREVLYEIQTPQFMSKDLLIEGFKEAQEKNITVTDDVSLVELLGRPVKIVEGSSTNIKITVKEDFVIAEALYQLYQIQNKPLL